jgi:hypothetical protein
MTVIIERISWLINVTDNNDAQLKPEISSPFMLILTYLTTSCHNPEDNCIKLHILNNRK